MRHPMRVAIAFDQPANTVRVGQPDETLSAWAHRRHLAGKSTWRNVINALFFWQPDHCEESHWSEVRRIHFPREYRG